MSKIMEIKGEMPLVASVLNNNYISQMFLSKFMTYYGASRTGKYLRFVDNDSYIKLYGE